MKKALKESWRLMGRIRLYARVGLKGMTPIKAYRMFNYWVKTTIFKKSIPWLIEFSVTYRCQCKCPHCSVGSYLDSADKKDELTNEQIKDVLDQAVKIGIPKVDFFGGEPLLKEGIVDLIDYGAKKGLYMSLTTNAWMLTPILAHELKIAGISCINISLDSITEEKHDSLRGLSGLYKKAIAAARYCHDEGIICILSTYITRNRVVNFAKGKADNSQLTQIINLAKKLQASAIRILFPIISGRWEGDKKKEFTEEEKRMVIENLDSSFAFIEGAYSVKKNKKVCQSLSGKMFNISPYGDVQLCVTFSDSFGNVKEDTLENLLRRMYRHPIYLKNKDGSCCDASGLDR